MSMLEQRIGRAMPTPATPPPGTVYPVLVHNGKLRVRSKVRSSTPQAAAVKALTEIRSHPGYRAGKETTVHVTGGQMCGDGCCGHELHIFDRNGDPVRDLCVPAGWAR